MGWIKMPLVGWLAQTVDRTTALCLFLASMTVRTVYRRLALFWRLKLTNPDWWRETGQWATLTAKGLIWAYWLALWWWIGWIPLVGRLVDLINTGKPTVAQLLQQIKEAQTWEDYQETAHQLDERLGLISWRAEATGSFNHKVIKRRVEVMQEAWEKKQYHKVVSLVRSHSRNIGNIASPKLYNAAFSGTKHIIEEYVCSIAQSIDRLVHSWPNGLTFSDGSTIAIPIQNIMDFVFDSRQAMGRTALFLQGGGDLALVNLGVARALRKHGILPRILVGESMGALVASIICTQREHDLGKVLDESIINLDAFSRRGGREADKPGLPLPGIFRTTWRRYRRWSEQGSLLDLGVIRECAMENIGSITFEEAYMSTKRILNIIIYREGDEPLVLNYITSPNVLIWSAAVASCCSSSPLFGGASATGMLMCRMSKDSNLEIPWEDTLPAMIATSAPPSKQFVGFLNSFIHIIGPMFHVTHWIVSQPNLTVAPLVLSDLHGPSHYQFSSILQNMVGWLGRWYVKQFTHYMRVFWRMGFVSGQTARGLVSEKISRNHITIVPELSGSDLLRVYDYPTRESVVRWSRLGEKATWPAIQSLRIRCLVEFELDRAYHRVRIMAQEARAEFSTQRAEDGENVEIQAQTQTPATHERRPTLARHNSDPVPNTSFHMTTRDQMF